MCVSPLIAYASVSVGGSVGVRVGGGGGRALWVSIWVSVGAYFNVTVSMFHCRCLQ